MADSAMDTYLNDHLAGAMFGSDLAEQIRSRAEGTPLFEPMDTVAREIEEDRQTLVALMERMESAKSPLKQATTWLAEKASRGKFGSLTATENAVGTFMALEALSLGVEGKRSLWIALREVADRYPAIHPAELDGLIDRADAQRQTLERARLEAARHALQNDS